MRRERKYDTAHSGGHDTDLREVEASTDRPLSTKMKGGYIVCRDIGGGQTKTEIRTA